MRTHGDTPGWNCSTQPVTTVSMWGKCTPGHTIRPLAFMNGTWWKTRIAILKGAIISMNGTRHWLPAVWPSSSVCFTVNATIIAIVSVHLPGICRRKRILIFSWATLLSGGLRINQSRSLSFYKWVSLALIRRMTRCRGIWRNTQIVRFLCRK